MRRPNDVGKPMWPCAYVTKDFRSWQRRVEDCQLCIAPGATGNTAQPSFPFLRNPYSPRLTDDVRALCAVWWCGVRQCSALAVRQANRARVDKLRAAATSAWSKPTPGSAEDVGYVDRWGDGKKINNTSQPCKASGKAPTVCRKPQQGCRHALLGTCRCAKEVTGDAYR